MAAPPKCAVIGGGVIGAAASLALAEHGADVTLFDQFALHHDRGSSHGPTRLFRTAYFEHANYVPLAQRSAAAWRALERRASEPLVHWTGVVLAGEAASALVSGTRAAARLHGLALHHLDGAELGRRFPGLNMPSDFEAFLEPDAGVILADRAHAALVRYAQDRGVEFVTEHKVIGWTSSPEGVRLCLANGSHMFDRVVIAPGAWAASLLGDVGALVRPVQKTLFWVAAGERAFHLDEGFVPFGVETPDGRFFYGFPAIDEMGVKVGEHTGGATLDVPEDKGEASTDDKMALDTFLRKFTPEISRVVTHQQTCLYAMSPDGNFIIDKHPQEERVAFAIGLSGHGFKFAPVIGEALAALALHGKTRQEFDFLKLARLDGRDQAGASTSV